MAAAAVSRRLCLPDENVEEWSVARVSEWARHAVGDEDAAARLQANKVNGNALLRARKEALRGLGIKVGSVAQIVVATSEYVARDTQTHRSKRARVTADEFAIERDGDGWRTDATEYARELLAARMMPMSASHVETGK